MNQDLRVGLLVPSFSASGEFDMPAIRLLVHELKCTVDVAIIPVRYPTVAGWEDWHGVDVHVPGGGGGPFRTMLLRTLWRLLKEHRRKPFDVLHALWLFEPGLIAGIAGRLLGVPVVCSIGGAELASMPEIHYGAARSLRGRLAARTALRGAGCVTGGSSYVLEQARDLSSTKLRLCKIPLPVDVDLFRPDDTRFPRSPKSGPRLLHVGSFLPVKDQLTLLVAFERILQQHPRATLKMIGEDPVGYRQRVERLSADLGIADRVTLRDRVSHRDLLSAYQSADLFVFPSRHESQGIAPLEALACGLPVVGSAVGAIRDLSPDAAVAVNPGEPDALARACLDLVANPDRARNLAKRGAERVCREYSPEASADGFNRIYRSLTAAGM